MFTETVILFRDSLAPRTENGPGTQAEKRESWALSFCTENPIVLVVNQMEQTFPLKIFREKRDTFRGIPLFSVLPEMIGKSCSICFVPLVPCSLKKKKTWRTPWVLVFSCPNESCGFQSIHADTFIARSCPTSGENYYL